MGKRRKLSCLPSTAKAKAGNTGPGNGGGSNQEPDGAPVPLNTTTGSGNGGHVESAPDANRKDLNPLDMPEILAHIFKLCSPDVLPNCRLVSKAWKAESLKIWRSSATLQFHYPGGNEIYLESGGNDTEDVVKTPLDKFLDFWKAECSRMPFHRFNLSQWRFALGSYNSSTKGNTTNRFWKLTGSNITTLILSDCVFSNPKVFRTIIFEACPNLQELSFDGCSRSFASNATRPMPRNEPEYQRLETGEQGRLESLSVCLKESGPRMSSFLPVSWLELFSHFPALTSLALSFELGDTWWNSEFYELIEQLINAIKLVRNHDERKLPIRKFCINLDSELASSIAYNNYGNSPGILQLFQDSNLPLELNALSVNLSRDDMIAVMETIASSRTSLVRLEALEQIGDLANLVWDFPFDTELPNLEKLKMLDRFSLSMEFLRFIPNLKELRIKGRRTGHRSLETHLLSQTLKPELADVKLLSLREFYFEFEVSDEDLRSLVGWLPNVEVLTMYLNDKQFAIVCDKWRNLEHLHVLRGAGTVTDAAITGRRGGMNSRKRNRDRQGGEGAEEILPNITYLNGLKCFKIPYGKSELTDVSAFEGFLKLPDLQILEIKSEENNFGDQAYEAMRSKIRRCEVSVAYRCTSVFIPAPITKSRRINCTDYFCDEI